MQSLVWETAPTLCPEDPDCPDPTVQFRVWETTPVLCPEDPDSLDPPVQSLAWETAPVLCPESQVWEITSALCLEDQILVLRLRGYIKLILRSHIGKYISSDKIVAEVNTYVAKMEDINIQYPLAQSLL